MQFLARENRKPGCRRASLGRSRVPSVNGMIACYGPGFFYEWRMDINKYYHWKYQVVGMPVPYKPFVITVPFERFTEEDIAELEKLAVDRKEIEELNRLMGFAKEDGDEFHSFAWVVPLFLAGASPHGFN